VTASLAAFVYFYEIRGEPARLAESEASLRLFPDLEAAGVDLLRIAQPAGETVEARRAARGWRLVRPLDFPGDPPSLDAMARALSEVLSEGRIEDPVDASVYGLGDSAIDVGFDAASGGGRIRLGRQTPVGASVYVAVERGRAAERESREEIHMIGTAQAALFDRSAEDLRDRRVLDFEPEDVIRVSIEAFGPSDDFTAVLERNQHAWTIVQPAALAADGAAVGRLLSNLSLLRAESFVDEPDRALLAALEAPAYRVTLEGPSRAKLVLTRTTADETDGVHTAQGRDGHLYRVSEALVGHLPRRLFALREKHVARFDPARASRVELRFDSGESISIERKDSMLAASGSSWESDVGPIDQGRFEDLLSSLSRLDAVDIVAEALGADEQAALGLRPAQLRIRVLAAAPAGEGESKGEGERKGEGTGEDKGEDRDKDKDQGSGEGDIGVAPPLLADVRFGRPFPERGPLAASGEGEAVHRLDVALDSGLPWSVGAFAEKFLAEAPEASEARPD
jgi:hypothetical protein